MVLEIFKEITKIPRCSGNKDHFVAYIKEFAQKNSYECIVDKAQNILCKKPNSQAKLALQSHYDIVCLEESKIPQIIENDGYLRAKDSTLGADNGIGCSYMLALMIEQKDLEFLFTSDEEIGLIGANNLSLDLKASYMLNLDSEDDNEICIGCAGGVDIFGTFCEKTIIQNDEKSLFEISIDTKAGGHSGVDIDKNIPNAIKLVFDVIAQCDGLLLDVSGGERINSIPKKAKAIIASHKTPIANHENMQISLINSDSKHLSIFDSKVVAFLSSFKNGVLEFNNNLGVVGISINLAKINTDIDGLKVEFSARAMDNNDLEIIKNKTVTDLQNSRFLVSTNGKYPSWKPQINDFTNIVFEIFKTYEPNVGLKAIHAGLECAVINDKFKSMKIASIGPNIYNPHSNSERVEIKSVEKVFEIVKKVVEKVG